MAFCCMNRDLILMCWQLHIWQLTLLEEIELIFSLYPVSFSSTILIATHVVPVAPITEPSNCKDFISCCWCSEFWRKTTTKQRFVLLRKTSISSRHWETKMNKYSNIPNTWFRRSGILKRANEWKEEKKKPFLPPVPGKASPLSPNHSQNTFHAASRRKNYLSNTGLKHLRSTCFSSKWWRQ